MIHDLWKIIECHCAAAAVCTYLELEHVMLCATQVLNLPKKKQKKNKINSFPTTYTHTHTLVAVVLANSFYSTRPLNLLFTRCHFLPYSFAHSLTHSLTTTHSHALRTPSIQLMASQSVSQRSETTVQS